MQHKLYNHKRKRIFIIETNNLITLKVSLYLILLYELVIGSVWFAITLTSHSEMSVINFLFIYNFFYLVSYFSNSNKIKIEKKKILLSIFLLLIIDIYIYLFIFLLFLLLEKLFQ